ncbi:MAG: DUF4177 domain-containing protein [Chloroflexota bacterium]
MSDFFNFSVDKNMAESLQRWEYKTITAIDQVVIEIDDNGTKIERNLFGQIYEGPSLSSVLERLGKKGWEVVGISPSGKSRPEYKDNTPILVILKRPLFD